MTGSMCRISMGFLIIVRASSRSSVRLLRTGLCSRTPRRSPIAFWAMRTLASTKASSYLMFEKTYS